MPYRTIFLVLVLLGLSGCYEDTGVTLHEPGVYKGSEDPLVAREAKRERQEQLRQRFRAVQADR